MFNASPFPTAQLVDVVDILDNLRVPINGAERMGRAGTVPYYGANGFQGWIDRPLFNEPLILLAEDGGNFDDFAARPIAYRIDGPAWVNNHAHVIRAKTGVCQSFIFWSIVNKDIRKYIAGGTRTKLTQGELRRIEINFPIENEQKGIAQILDILDTAIHETEAIIAKLKAIKQGLLHDLLTRGIDTNGELRPPQTEAPHLYKESPLGWIPKEWEVPTLAHVCSLIRDGTHLPPVRVADGPLLLSVRNMQDGEFILTEQDTRVSEAFYSQMHKHWEVRNGDVLLAIVGATIGKTAIVGDMPKFTLQRSVAVLRGKPDNLLNPFLYLYMGSPEFQLSLWAQVNQTAQPGIYLDQLGAIRVPLPFLAEQELIQKKLQVAQSRIDEEIRIVLKLKTQKSGLMDDLLTGRVRVTPLLESNAP